MTSVGVISHLLATQYLAPANQPSNARFQAVHKNQGLSIQTLLGHTTDAQISVAVSHTFDEIVLGSYAPYFCTNSFPVFQAPCIIFDKLEVACDLSCLACQNVVSVSADFAVSPINPPIYVAGLYCEAVFRNDAVLPSTFGTSETAPPTKSVIEPQTFSSNQVLASAFFAISCDCTFACSI